MDPVSVALPQKPSKNLRCNSVQEYKAQQSRNSSLSPHDWLEQDENDEDVDSDVSDDYYNDPEDDYIQPYRNGQEQYRNGHGNYRNGSNSSSEYGNI